jgi:hypothetical protein
MRILDVGSGESLVAEAIKKLGRNKDWEVLMLKKNYPKIPSEKRADQIFHL